MHRRSLARECDHVRMRPREISGYHSFALERTASARALLMTVPWNYCGNLTSRDARGLKRRARWGRGKGEFTAREIHSADGRRLSLFFEGDSVVAFSLYRRSSSISPSPGPPLTFPTAPRPFRQLHSRRSSLPPDFSRMLYFTVTARSSGFRPRYRRSVPSLTISHPPPLPLCSSSR